MWEVQRVENSTLLRLQFFLVGRNTLPETNGSHLKRWKKSQRKGFLSSNHQKSQGRWSVSFTEVENTYSIMIIHKKNGQIRFFWLLCKQTKFVEFLRSGGPTEQTWLLKDVCSSASDIPNTLVELPQIPSPIQRRRVSRGSLDVGLVVSAGVFHSIEFEAGNWSNLSDHGDSVQDLRSGWWLNQPNLKNMSQNGNQFRQGSGWKLKKHGETTTIALNQPIAP